MFSAIRVCLQVTRAEKSMRHEAIAPSEKPKGSKKLPAEDIETKRLRKRLRTAITARSRETVDDLRQQLERRRQEWINTKKEKTMTD